MVLEQILDTEKVPKRLNIPWLNDDYIRKYGWVPDKNRDIQEQYELCRRLGIPCKELYEIIGFEDTDWGVLPVRDIRTIKPGDITIFYDYEETVNERGEYDTDKFEVMDEEFHKQILADEWGAPHGVVVPCPDN